ncbi:MAG TPA: response regulator [Candidatus Polarisedimenticolaceae bacterium]|nr:response regulator [Candidatus Polarisedimenticolaceae bacterium]
MTERTAAERRLAAQHAAALALARSASLADAAPEVLRALCQALGWAHGALWNVAADAGVLRCVTTWHEEGVGAFDTVTRESEFPRGVGLPGRVWESAKPAWIHDVTKDANFPRGQIAAADGLHGAFGFPIRIGPQVFGVMEFFSREIQEPDPPLLAMLGTVGIQIGQFLSRKRAEQQLDKFFTMSLDLLCIAGADGYFKRLNGAWEKTLGFTIAELLAKPYLHFIHVDDREATLGQAAGLARGENVISFQNRYLCKDGSYRWIFWNATYDPKEERVYAIGRDVTERRLAQEAQEENAHRLALLVTELERARHRAEEAARVKADFLANMSHEIRTPMNAIMGMTDLALGTKLSGEQRGYLTTVKGSAKALLALVDDILDLSKIEAGKLELDKVAFDFRETVEDAIKVLAVRAGEKGLELACRIAPEVPPAVVGDPGRLRQVVVNLVGNAIKFTAKGEVVLEAAVVTAGTDDVDIKVAVRDTGIGIPEDKRRLIFGAFTQADTSTTRRFGGTGLGLAIATQLVEMMGGTIEVASAVGQGSTFSFTARFGITEDVPEPRRPHAEPANLAGLPVLVVDDNATNRQILCEMLANWRMSPVSAEGGTAALARMKAAEASGRPFRLILSDGQMPEMDGFMLAAAVKGDPILRHLPMILLTSAGRPGDGAKSRRLGIAAFLTKPVKQSDLLDTMTSVLTGMETAEPEAVPIAPAARPLRILVAEDNPLNQRVARHILEKRGHTVVIARNGREAIDALAPGAAPGFNLVLMDVQMPELDGFAATAAIRQREAGAKTRIPILAMTAHAMEGDRERCLAAGMDGYVTKPVEADRLLEAVEGAVASFDPATAMARLKGDRALLREMIEIFLADAPAMVGAIRSALEAGDAETLRRAAHALKGSVANFAAARAVAEAKTLETMGASGDLSGAAAVLARLENALERFRTDALEETAP